ncbi:unnamed protein product [Adineta ricciae]|uniref:Uncharacterized protein n=1 Tax=Adineta ricciae TaxID=249248 RepID=A0A815F972_ADIRI|nr:unnamed protein product [Adineta ricciae]CAF1325389.1 unnamed protein product [Adineta ricciae]
MSDDATIEDEPEIEQATRSSRPETDTGLLKWSYIFEMAAKNWLMFLAFSLAVAIFLYLSRKRQRKSVTAALRGDYVPGSSKSGSRSTPNKRD